MAIYDPNTGVFEDDDGSIIVDPQDVEEPPKPKKTKKAAKPKKSDQPDVSQLFKAATTVLDIDRRIGGPQLRRMQRESEAEAKAKMAEMTPEKMAAENRRLYKEDPKRYMARGRLIDELRDIAPTEEIEQRRKSRFRNEREALASAGRTIGTMVSELPQGLGSLADVLNIVNPFVAQEDVGILEERLKPITEKGLKFTERVTPLDPQLEESYGARKIPSALASAGAFVGLGLAGRLARLPAFISSAGLGSIVNAAEVAREADKMGVDPTGRKLAVAFGGLTGLTEAAGLGRAIERFGLKQAFTKRLIEIAEEGGQEALQEWLNNLNAKVIGGYDPGRPLTKDVLESAILGGIVGAGFQAMSLGAGAIPLRKAKPGLVPPVANAMEDLVDLDFSFPPRGKILGLPHDLTYEERNKVRELNELVPAFLKGEDWARSTVQWRYGGDIETLKKEYDYYHRLGELQGNVELPPKPVPPPGRTPTEREANRSKFLQLSAAKKPDGTPLVLYQPSVLGSTEPNMVKTNIGDLGTYLPGVHLYQDPEIASAKANPNAFIPATGEEIENHPAFSLIAEKHYLRMLKAAEDTEKAGGAPVDERERSYLKLRANTEAGYDVADMMRGEGKSPNLRPYLLDVRNPFEIQGTYDAEQIGEIIEALQKKMDSDAVGSGLVLLQDEVLDGLRDGVSGQEIYEQLKRDTEDISWKIVDILKDSGYDGFTYVDWLKGDNTMWEKRFETGNAAADTEAALQYGEQTGTGVAAFPTMGIERKFDLSVEYPSQFIYPIEQAANDLYYDGVYYYRPPTVGKSVISGREVFDTLIDWLERINSRVGGPERLKGVTPERAALNILAKADYEAVDNLGNQRIYTGAGPRYIGAKVQGSKVWVPFEEGQLKSATGNIGDFDRELQSVIADAPEVTVNTVNQAWDVMAAGLQISPIDVREQFAYLDAGDYIKYANEILSGKLGTDVQARGLKALEQPINPIDIGRDLPPGWHYGNAGGAYGPAIYDEEGQRVMKVLYRGSYDPQALLKNIDVMGSVMAKEWAMVVREQLAKATSPTIAFVASNMEKIIREKWPTNLTVVDIEKRLASEASGIKGEEIQFSGIREYLSVAKFEGQKYIKRDEMLQWLEEHNVRVGERIFGGPQQIELTETRDKLAEELEEANDKIRELAKQFPPYDTWISTGENYAYGAPQRQYLTEQNQWLASNPEIQEARREALRIQEDLYKTEKRLNEIFSTHMETAALQGDPGTMREIVLTVPIEAMGGKPWQEGHFAQVPGAFAYFRFNEKTDEEGKRIMVVQNIQSDLHQKGRVQGYGDIKVELNTNPETKESHPFRVGKEVFTNSQNANTRARSLNKSGVPDAPFKDTWPSLLLKRAVRWAADNGFDRIVWTTGDQQQRHWADYMTTGDVVKITYDEKWPKAAKDLATRFKGRTGMVDWPRPGIIVEIAEDPFNAPNEDTPWKLITSAGDTLWFNSEQEAEDFLMEDPSLAYTSEQWPKEKVHYLDVSPEMAEASQTGGFAMYHKNWLEVPKDLQPKAKDDIIRRWNVPRWDPRTSTVTAKEMLPNARFETKRFRRGVRLYTNNIGTIVSQAVDYMTQLGVSPAEYAQLKGRPPLSSVHGSMIPVHHVERMLKWLDEFSEDSPSLGAFRDQLEQAFAIATVRGQKGLPLVSLDRTDINAIRQTIRHEDIHMWQWANEEIAGMVTDPAWEKLQPWYNKIVAGLKARYNFPKGFERRYMVEAVAHLGAGQHEIMGLTAEEGAEILTSILMHVAETRGIAALKKIVLDVKVQERVNELRGSREFGTATSIPTEQSARGFGQRIRDFFGGGRKPEGKDETTLSPPIGDFDNIDTDTRPPGRFERVRNALRGNGLPFEFTWLDKLKRLGIDEAHPILKAWHFIKTGQEAPSENAEYLLRLWLGSNGKVDRIFSEGMINSVNQVITPGGMDWLLGPWDGMPRKQAEDEMSAAINMMVAQRTLELATKQWAQPGSNKGIDDVITGVADKQTIQQAGGSHFLADVTASIRLLQQMQTMDPAVAQRVTEAAKRYRDWTRALLDYTHDKGRMSDETYNKLVANGDSYVDLHRILEDDEDAILDSTPSKYGKVKKIMRKFGGSEKNISNPYLNLMIQTENVIRETDRNEAMNAYVEPLRTPQQDPLLQSLYHSIGHSVPRPTRDSVRVWNNGKMENWEFHSEIEAALKGYGDMPADMITRVLGLPFDIIRASITHSPGFLARNFLRDAQQRTLLSRTNDKIATILNPLEGSKPWDAVTTLFRPLSKADRDSFWLTGASQAGYYMSSRADWQARLNTAMNQVRGDKRVVFVYPQALYKALAKDIPTGLENVNRQAEFKTVQERGKAAGMTDYDANIMAAFEARDLMDFAVIGSAIKKLNKFVLFLNPAIQGLKRTQKAIREKPLPFLFRWAMYSLVPSLGELWWNWGQGDDELKEWQQLPAWRKDFFYNLKIGPDRWLTFPKPFELGVAASLTNRLIDYGLLGNKDAFNDSSKSILRSLLPVDDPSKVIGPFIPVAEYMGNWSYFYDEHIIPPGDEKRDPDYARRRGSFIGGKIGELVNQDPRMIDYAMRSMFSDWATIAGYTSELFNAELKPAERAENNRRLITLMTGNMVRPTKPDQAVSVKRVMDAAYATYGDRADWYEPLVEGINNYRDFTEPLKREQTTREVLAYADHVSQFLPRLRADMDASMDKVDKLEETNGRYKRLDKRARNVIDSTLRSTLRAQDHEIMTARVRGDKLAEADAIAQKRAFNLRGFLAEEIENYQQEQLEKKAEDRLTPPMPRR